MCGLLADPGIDGLMNRQIPQKLSFSLRSRSRMKCPFISIPQAATSYCEIPDLRVRTGDLAGPKEPGASTPGTIACRKSEWCTGEEHGSKKNRDRPTCDSWPIGMPCATIGHWPRRNRSTPEA